MSAHAPPEGALLLLFQMHFARCVPQEGARAGRSHRYLPFCELRFCDMRMLQYHGSGRVRDAAKMATEYDIVVTTYQARWMLIPSHFSSYQP